jgi:hypothetical protein
MSIFEFLKNFWEKKNIKKMKKNETIKKIKVRQIKNIFNFCDDNFFFINT